MLTKAPPSGLASLVLVLRLGWRNVLRQRRRHAAVFAAATIGVAALILSQGFVADILDQLGEAIIHSRSGHLQVANTGFFDGGAHHPERYLLVQPSEDARRIGSMPDVADVMARLTFSGLINNGRNDLAIIGEGMEPDREQRLGTYLKIVAGRELRSHDQYGALIGHGVASALGLAPGDRVVIVAMTGDGTMNSLDIEVIGIFKSFSKDYDDRAVKIPLSAARQLMDTAGATTLVVALRRTVDTDSVANQIRTWGQVRGQETRTWTELNDFYPKSVALYRAQFGALQIIIFLMVILSVFSSVSGLIFERTAEFATVRALGNTSGDVVRIIIVETVMVGVFAGMAGAALGVGCALLLSNIGIPMPPPPNADLPYVARISVSTSAVLASAAIVVAATFAGCLLPARKMGRMEICRGLLQRM
jgi:putative ABC transport system permease protein